MNADHKYKELLKCPNKKKISSYSKSDSKLPVFMKKSTEI